MRGDDGGGRNKLLMPLVAVSVLCAAEAVVIAFLLGRGGGGGPERAPQVTDVSSWVRKADAAVGEKPAAPAATEGPAITRGKVGQRVESAGLAITVLAVSNEPRFKEVTAPPATQKFVNVEVLLENHTGKGHGYFSTTFKIKDGQERVYGSGGLGVHEPPLEYGTIVAGEKVRGNVCFVVPKEATGLTLTYPANNTPPGYRPFHIDLGQ